MIKAQSHRTFFIDCDCDSCYRNKWVVQNTMEVFTLCDCTPALVQPIVRKNKSQWQIVCCERALRGITVTIAIRGIAVAIIKKSAQCERASKNEVECCSVPTHKQFYLIAQLDTITGTCCRREQPGLIYN